MSLKRRNILAWILLILAALGWSGGLGLLRNNSGGYEIETSIRATEPTYYNTTYPTIETSMPFASEPTASVEYVGQPKENSMIRQVLGYSLCLSAVIAAVLGTVVFSPQKPLLGPDGSALVAVLVDFYSWNPLDTGNLWRYGFLTFFVLAAARELVYWIRSRFPLKQTLLFRLGQRFPVPQLTLSIYATGLLLPVLALWWFYNQTSYSTPVLGLAALVILSLCCLWRYGKDLQHFRHQLECFEKELPITVGSGTFADTEEKLQQLQTMHRKAIDTAVTSERFKVELIANVSHDLRTPLTSILGYGELLEQQKLPEEAQKQLALLNQKAGYMRDLVDSLFELTKVSSGAAEGKQEQIDLIRLLEQTLGLFDDQLQQAGLTVRRHYGADAIPVVTDGARMHQVFANLLGNAIKYALPGTRIHLEADQTDIGCRVRMVNISAYEMNFSPEEILQRFARGDQARTTKGSGLGLAIAQTYTESVGGSFRIEIDGDQFSAIVEL